MGQTLPRMFGGLTRDDGLVLETMGELTEDGVIAKREDRVLVGQLF